MESKKDNYGAYLFALVWAIANAWPTWSLYKESLEGMSFFEKYIFGALIVIAMAFYVLVFKSAFDMKNKTGEILKDVAHKEHDSFVDNLLADMSGEGEIKHWKVDEDVKRLNKWSDISVMLLMLSAGLFFVPHFFLCIIICIVYLYKVR